MKPYLYKSKEILFETKGLGCLADVHSCKVTQERNGMYELEMEYPSKGLHFSDVVNDNIIMAVPEDGAEPQPFRIYKVSKPLNGICKVYAQHVSYALNNIPVRPFEATGIADALNGLVTNSVVSHPFTVWTDISNAESRYRVSVPMSFRKLLGGVQGSILDSFGGEFDFDRWTVKVYAHRGRDNGVRISYGKNLTSLLHEEETDKAYTGIFPFYANDEGDLVTLSENVIERDTDGIKKYLTLDLSDEFESVPSEDELRAKAQSYFDANISSDPELNVKISFLALWQTAEYRNIASLERVKLCDTVTCFVESLGVDVKTKVVKTVYNVLADRYDSIELGTVRGTLSSSVASTITKQESAEEDTKSMLESALNAQKHLMDGGLGGNKVETYNGDGKPSGTIYMDADTVGASFNKLVIGNTGIGFYHGEQLVSSWTIDGTFSAENINAGTLSADRIAAETINVQKLSGDLQNLAKSVTVNTDGIHIQKLDGHINVEAVMEADGLHLYYGTANDRTELAFFTTTKASVRNLYAETYFYCGTHRQEAFTAKKMSNGEEATGTAWFYGGKL